MQGQKKGARRQDKVAGILRSGRETKQAGSGKEEKERGNEAGQGWGDSALGAQQELGREGQGRENTGEMMWQGRVQGVSGAKKQAGT